VTDADIEPAVARVIHPVVLLPAALLGRLSSAQMSAVLAHEGEHIARRDNLKAGAHRLVETLFWFHPAVWWIGRRMLEERERACDEVVLGSGHDPVDYAAGILEVCRHCRTRVPLFSAAGSGDLTRRVRYILGSGQPSSLSPIKALALSLAVTLTAAAPLFAGAAHGTARRHELLTVNSLALGSADVYLEQALDGGTSPHEVLAARNEVVIRNSTLRDMVALAYGVHPWEVVGGGEWMDSPRYVVRAVARTPVSDPEDLDPHALRGIVTKLLANRFDLRVEVNSRCQSPCGRSPH
jgi:bla regulator protein BlaR1